MTQPLGAEAARQRALLAALHTAGGEGATGHATDGAAPLALREAGTRRARGLEAYRANAQTLADRALAAVFGTVRAMLGDDDFAHLAAEYWLVQPPVRGDLGEWGGGFPDWLAAHAGMSPWPWLSDCARLDLALHRNERAADAVFDAASLSLLEATDPAQLHLVLMPGTEVLRAAWPVVTIHHAHQAAPEASEAAFAAVRSALAAQRAEQVLVVRDGWRAAIVMLDAPTAAWTTALLRGASLDAALADAAVAPGDPFDFAGWLGMALRGAWLKGVVVSGD